MANKRHRLLRPNDGVHVVHAWEVSMLEDIGGLVQADIGKIARMEREGEPGRYDFYVLVRLELNELGDIPTWMQLGASSWVTWQVASLNDVTPTLGDRSKVARVDAEGAISYWVLADVVDSEGITPTWLRLDNVAESIIRWTVEPEGSPAAVGDIPVTPADLHGIAYDPSGTAHYWILYSVDSDGEGGYFGNWAPLDEPAPDISGKADKLIERMPFTGTSRTVDAGDFDTLISSSNAALQTFTLQPLADSPVRSLLVMQQGTGRVRFAPGAGVTIRPPGTIETTGQWSVATLSLIGTNEWLVTGDVTVS